ncbi:polysaccharide biosynthesis protein [Thalassoroseus pseudoceratinae]|uniref:polysaccharide biosynthesis protein n=1 Tax=Thalassoroseus pseudoceratinae TaxID=2713176 RepID=UPI00141D8C7F|nr:nucleoside-diphosphate sugar epimerase/dehydratase [Thalassoroseus pseudoceratinae]
MKHRMAAVLPTYLAIYVASYYTAFVLRCDFNVPPVVFDLFRYTLPIILAVKFVTCLGTGEWRRAFRYASLHDVQWVGIGATLAAVAIYITNLTVLRWMGIPIPRSVIVIDWGFTIMASALLRMSFRLYAESIKPLFRGSPFNPALIYGAKSEGVGILRAIQTGQTNFNVVGLIGGGPRKPRSIIAGVRVYSKHSSLTKLVNKTGARHLLVPGSVPGKELRELTRQCSKLDIKVHVIPGVQEIVGGRYRLSVREVTINDLLRRDPAELDLASIQNCLTGRRVLVTGAAGSIGSELCRQILDLDPACLVLVDQSEYGTFLFEQELRNRKQRSEKLHFVIADVTDRASMSQVFDRFQPEIVFHAAAYKHVPLMEENPREAVRNNIGGTKTVADLAAALPVERFVLISTDKAVRPTSIMGSTKLVAEKYVQTIAAQTTAQFVTVRFGNVLNSAGSVVPTFRRQIERGGPITVTHPEMTRFFMTIPEAVQLVLQAGAIGDSGDILILEMGEPVKILDLAQDMIALSGLKPHEDIDIVFSGIRPGEKLYEELFYLSEEGTKKVHDKIFRAQRDPSRLVGVLDDIATLEQAVETPQADIATDLRRIVRGYVDAETWTDDDLRSAA